MKKLNFIFITLLFVAFSASSQSRKKADKDTEEWRYELEVVQQGHEGSYLVKVWSYSKKANVAIEQAKKNAIHGIIFRGVSASGRVPGQPALTNNPNLEMEKQEFFDDFFADGGKYMKFVQVSGDGSVAAEDRLKVGKEYKIGVVLSINVEGLRNDLQATGMIKSLSSGF
jgi:hypothetical protein